MSASTSTETVVEGKAEAEVAEITEEEAAAAEEEEETAAEQEEAQAQAEAGAEEASEAGDNEAYNTLVRALIPKTISEAKKNTEHVRGICSAASADLAEIGRYVLAMRERTPGSKAADHDGQKARPLNNGFGLLGYTSEGEWAYDVGLAERRSKLGKKGQVKYNVNRLQRAVLAARLDIQLVDSGLSAGAAVLDHSTRSVVFGSSRSTVDAVIPTIIARAKAGGTSSDIAEAVLAAVKEISIPAAKLKVADMTTDALVARCLRLGNATFRHIEERLRLRIFAFSDCLKTAFRRKGITPDQRNAMVVCRDNLVDSLGYALSDAGVEVNKTAKNK